MGKKNIILLERYNGGENLTEAILNNTDYNIVILLVGNKKEKEKFINNKRIKKIYIREEGEIFNQNDISSLDYKTIEDYRFVQSDFESGTGRVIVDYNLRKEAYYRALFFWYDIFNNLPIDMLIVNLFNHGMADDCIPLAIAKKMKIKSYIITEVMLCKVAIYDDLNKIYIKRNNLFTGDIEQSKNYFYDFDADTYNNKKIHYAKKMLNKWLYAIGGTILVKLGSDMKRLSFKEQYMKINGSEVTTLDLCLAYIKTRMIKRYLDKQCILPRKNEKYIIYYLQVEPEATIQVRCTLQSQLTAIVMLARHLPKDWKLYVKEHPHQFSVNKRELFFRMINLPRYKNKEFYNKIKSLPNVELIKTNYESKKLNKDALAIASFNSTVILETMDLKKPIMIFGGETTLYQYDCEFFNIKSDKECSEAIKKISGGFIPNYEKSEEKLRKYLFSKDSDGYCEITKLINTINN